jgi:pimeloyl-ACP methyl ester carboxylesterase
MKMIDALLKMIGALPAVLLLLLLIAAIWGKVASCFDPGDPLVEVHPEFDHKADVLYVMIPGLLGPDKTRSEWHKLAAKLGELGDVAMVDYPAHPGSNAKAEKIAQQINTKVQAIWEKKQYPRVIVVGYSMGALIARKALLYSQGAADDCPRTATTWSTKVERMVLLAGMNRGWDLSGEKPADMRGYRYYMFSLGAWGANLTHSARLLMQMESGAPFVANLRLEWMRWAGSEAGRHLETVQLLGDIDDIVSAEDNADLRVSGKGGKFAWLKVRGTGHEDILKISETREHLGEYRLKKILLAIDTGFDELKKYSEELPYQTDDEVTQVVFVMHGIRDLGEWSSEIETALREQISSSPANIASKEKLAIASVRYGYFGMGQFLLRRDRQKYVRWFMDQYTETLARYPNARKVDFIGHSNGTYLLGGALAAYPSMKIRRIVLGGSVLPKDYDWATVFRRKQAQFVRNYVADDDWVVALFPRFFEPRYLRWLGNDIGSAGFNGFDAGNDGPGRQPVDNVKFIQGGHAAFLKELSPIANFLIPPAGTVDPVPMQERRPPERSSPILNSVSKYFTWPIVWFPLVFIVIWLGTRVSNAAGHFAAVALIVYMALVFQVLRWI